MRRRLVPALAMTLLVSVAACERDDAPPVAVEILGDDVEMAMLNMDHYLTREGVRRARLRADTAEFLDDGVVRMRPIELTFFDEQGNELSVVTGDHGTYNEDTEDMEARGTVVAIDHRDDQRLETTHLRYHSQVDRLFGDEAFTLYRDNGRTILRGSRFETDPGLASILMFDSSGQTEQAPPPRPVTPPAASVGDSGIANDSVVVGDSSAVVDPTPAAETPVVPDSVRDTITVSDDTTGVAPPDTTSAMR